MNDVLSKIKKYKYIIIGGIIIVVLYVCSLWSDRKDVYDNGKPTDAIRNELDRAEGAKQDIADTASDIADTSAKLENANLINANLWNANLEDANLEDANLEYANLENVNLYNADLRNRII